MSNKMVAIKGSDIGRTIDISALAEELNNHPNGGFVFISRYLNLDGEMTDQWLRLCSTNEQRGAGYISAKASDLDKINLAIEDLRTGIVPVWGESLTIKRGAKFAEVGHDAYIDDKHPVEVSANTRKNCSGIMQLNYSVSWTDPRIMEALLDIQRSIVAPRQTGLADYSGEGSKGLFSLEKDGTTSFYLREVYHHFSCESKDENGNIISGYRQKTKTEPSAIKDAIGKALGLRRDKYRSFKLTPDRFDTIHIAKKVLTMDGRAGEFSVIDPATAKDWLGVSIPEDELDALLAQINSEPVSEQA